MDDLAVICAVFVGMIVLAAIAGSAAVASIPAVFWAVSVLIRSRK